MLVGDVRHEGARVAVGPQPGSCLVPDDVPLGNQAGGLRPRGQLRAGESVPSIEVGIPHDHGRVPARTEDAGHFTEGALHQPEIGIVRGRVGEVRRIPGHHRVVGATVRVPLGERPPGHRQRQLDGVGRVRRHEVDARRRQSGQELQRVADAKLAACRVERADAGWIGVPQVRQERPRAAPFRQRRRDDIRIDRRPAWVQLEPERATRPASDRCAQQRPADAGERIQHELAGPGEELDQACHQPGRLVRAVRSPERVTQLGGVRGGQDRLGEVQPLLPRQLVERVGGMGHLSHQGSLPSACRRLACRRRALAAIRKMPGW